MMAQELKKRWVAALRSGDYPQAKRKLRTPEGFCCLGVGMMVLGLPLTPENSRGTFFRHQGGEIFATKALGITGIDEVTLTAMNDQGATFNTIADWIEAHL